MGDKYWAIDEAALPWIDTKANACNSPHVVILGAGASLAALPNGDKFGRIIPLMNNLVGVTGLDYIMARHGLKYNGENFEDIFDKLVVDETNFKLINELQEALLTYFKWIQLPDEATIYDYLVLSLRKKDIIATFNWDPLLSQAFVRNMKVIGYENMPEIVYLHGNVAIGVCNGCKQCGWRYNKCDKCNKPFGPSNLLYPVSHKNYNQDPFLKDQWQILQRHIQYAYLITIFGYSAPITDVEAKEIMLNAWKKNRSTDFGIIEIIDVKPKNEIKKMWEDFIIRDRYSINGELFSTQLAYHPRRSCDAFAMATLQQNPWKDNPLPKNISLKELQQWMLQLVKEEKINKFTGNPCS